MDARQTPTFSVNVPTAPDGDGESAAQLASAYFGEPLEWQRRALGVLLSRDEHDRYAVPTFAMSVPRQNGKSWIVRARCFYGLVCCGEQILFTCQHGDTSGEMFRDLAAPFEDEDNEELHPLLKAVRKTNGQQAIYLTNGGMVRFTTRTDSLARGRTYDVLVYDEAQELTSAQQAASMPTISAGKTKNTQTIYLGTPPGPTCAGDVFARMHDMAHVGQFSGVWMERVANELPPADASEDELLDLAYETNPALGTRITERAVRNEIAQMTPDGFARERLGWWPARGAAAVPLLDPAKWDAARVADEVGESASGKMAFGVKFSPDGRRAAVSCCIRPADGSPDYVELVDMGGTGAGMAWLVSMVMRHASEVSLVAVDGRAGAAALANQLAAQGLPRRALHECATADVASAATMMVEAVNAGTVCHIASPSMDESATRSVRRDIGKNGAFSFGDGPDSTSLPVESAALALWAVRTTRRDPTRKQRVW